MTINELRNKRAKLWEGTKAFLETHRRENGTLSAEDDATYAKMEQEISDLGREISRLERQEAMDAELSKPVNTPIIHKPEATAKVDTKTGRASNAYKDASHFILYSHPWKAEVTEGDTTVAEETIVNWYNEVYEPTYTA